MAGDKKFNKLIENMYADPEFCPYIGDEIRYCEMKAQGFDCSKCEPSDRYDFVNRYLESGGKDKSLPVKSKPTQVKIECKVKDDPSIVNESLESVENTGPIEESDLDLESKPILIVDKRGIIQICDNEERATNLSNDIIINRLSDEILIYRPVRRIARSTSIEDL